MASITYVITVRDGSVSPPGTRKTGLTPTWVFLKKLSDGTDIVSPPAIVEVAQGQYRFAYDPEASGEASGQIDAGSALANPSDRYVDVVLAADGSRVSSVQAEVTNATYGLAKLVRSQTPANALAVDANHRVDVGWISGQVAFVSLDPAVTGVVAASPAPGQTAFAVTGLSVTATIDNEFRGRALVFTSGTDAGEAEVISASTLSTGLLTFASPGFVRVPAAGDSVRIIGRLSAR